MHDRERIYRELWPHANRLGLLQKTQRELAVELGLHYQRLCMIFKEYTKIGLMKKYRRTFQMKNPDAVDWDSFKENRREALDIWQKT